MDGYRRELPAGDTAARFWWESPPTGAQGSHMESVKTEVLQALTAKFGGCPQMADELASFGVDSLGMAELIAEFEERFHIKADEEILGIETVAELIRYVEKRT
jgi:acyl carrier protein